ncbi:DUF1501 domain-containing protein [Nevskia ramosa]|uniref:DUF1501 domain-containing protein n=1 Tax=Nevskia ramosa TaxID=64002 RepID=UPI001469D4C0|nr:DUF1501 domain-containing protein [Nevskia ramosa]
MTSSMHMHSPTNHSRRDFLSGLGCLGGGLLLNTLPSFSAQAQGFGDYKALVCVFLLGGNDGNNMIVPNDTAGYGKYAAIRGDYTRTSGAVGLPRSELLALQPASGNAAFGAHPALTHLQQVWNAGDLAVLFNVGTLARPLTKAGYGNCTLTPDNLFSHADQQAQWQSAVSQGISRTGWGGRLADAVRSANGAAPVPPLVAWGRNDLFAIGNSTMSLSVPSSGTFGLTNFGGGSYRSSISGSLNQMLQLDRGNALVASAQDTVQSAITSSGALSPILSGTSSSINGFFSGQSSGIAQQLLQTARMIEARGALGVSRQIFYVALGGFDTHNSQIETQAELFGQLSPALKAFQDSMAQLGMADQVTTFTVSDFGRTLKPASGGGTDHAWGNHHLVMGGAVRGQRFYGQFPEHALGGPDDVTSEGRWLPTTSVDQYGATLSRWFGVSDADLATVFPNLQQFPNKDLGFLG